MRPADQAIAAGAAIRRRREELGLTMTEVSERGGPGLAALGRIEGGRVKRPQPRTLDGLDRALRWPAGTSRQLYSTGGAVQQATSATPTPSHAPQPESVPIRLSEVASLALANSQISDFVHRIGDSEGINYASTISTITSAVLGRWIDYTIAHGDDVSIQMIASILNNQPDPDPESPEYNDQLYRRWRLNLLPSHKLPATVLKYFRDRLSVDQSNTGENSNDE
ncbi:hypothetical protein CXF29_00205 [Corynebacterium bovis]|uniref:helix-turn-helix domain-containing protein n=1 Tax=Corynebacterium bovis TaxID=36808 RepID=UPI000F653BB2|nr:hypothetical protein CXF29_00205 [Corynebacterium bovis]